MLCKVDVDVRRGGLTSLCAAAGSAAPQVDMAQRFVVIRCLRAQCESGQLLVDLFVNYDCDLEGQNLFERMVLALVRLAQGNVPQDATAQVVAEEQAMRLAVSTAWASWACYSLWCIHCAAGQVVDR